MPALVMNIANTLALYDSEGSGHEKHASALKAMAGEEMAMAVLMRYLREKRHPQAAFVAGPCTAKGAHLDGWIDTSGSKRFLYQVEIKAWSMHGYGSEGLMVRDGMVEKQFRAYRTQAWAFYFDSSSQRFIDPKVGKVVRKMRQDRLGSPHRNAAVKALLCLWSSVHPTGLNKPFFELPVRPLTADEFDRVSVFSVSTYLRNLLAAGCLEIELEMPKLAARLRLIDQTFSIPSRRRLVASNSLGSADCAPPANAAASVRLA